MCRDLSGWEESTMYDVQKKTLKTLDKILEDADKDRLSSDDLDDVKDCLMVLSMIDAHENHEEVPEAVAYSAAGKSVLK